MNPIESAMSKAGFRLIGTGGGCTAFCCENSRLGSYILITDEASAPEDLDQMCAVGFYPSADHTEPAFTFSATPRQVVAMNIRIEP